MEPLAQLADRQPENPGKPERKRRWWLVITVSILGSLILFSVWVFANREPSRYAFLEGATLKSSQGWISPSPHVKRNYLGNFEYDLKLSFVEVRKRATKELTEMGWKVRMIDSDSISYYDPQSYAMVNIDREEGVVKAYTSYSREATTADRVRLWFKERYNKFRREQTKEALPMDGAE